MSDLPYAVKRRLQEKREDGQVIGVCGGCGEEVYANKDGILRSRLMSGSERCGHGLTKNVEGPHLIQRFYHSGPLFWIIRWQGKVNLPDWAEYFLAQKGMVRE